MSDRALSIAIAACLVTAFGLPAVLLGDRDLITFFHDDAFYYFQVARNVVAGSGFTFDGLHRTNGFHPLWLFLVSPVFAIAEGNVVPLRAIGLLEAGLIAAAGGILFATLAPRLGRAPAAAAALALGALPGARSILWSGMESSLLLVLLLVVWNRSLAPSGRTLPRSYIALGLWCALAFAARFEAILVLPALVVALPGVRQRRSMMTLAAPTAAVLALHVAFNRIGFGTWIPISAMVKAHWASTAQGSWLDALLSVPWIGRELICRAFGAGDVQLCPEAGVALYVVLELTLLALLVVFRRRVFEAVGRSGVLFLLIASGLIVGADLLGVMYLAPWYRAPILLCTAIAAGLVLHRFPRAAAAVCFLLAAGMLARTILHVTAPRDPRGQYAAYRVEAAEWLAANTAKEERIGSWNAGMMGYFSGRHVVNLDGLANDLDYFRQVTQGRDLAGYLARERIGFLADQACGPTPSPDAYLRRTGSETLATRCTLERAFYNETSADQCPGFAVWRIDPGVSNGSLTTSNSVATSSPESPALQGLTYSQTMRPSGVTSNARP